MGRAKIVEINGRKYDTASGRLLKHPSRRNSSGSIDGVVQAKPSSQLHSSVKKSTTLNRRTVKKPEVSTVRKKSASVQKTIHRSQQAKSHAHRVDENRQKKAGEHQRSQLISKFSNRPADVKTEEVVNSKQTERTNEKPQFAHSNYSPPTKTEGKATKTKSKKAKKKRIKNRPRAATVFSTAAAAILIIGYITYLNIPNLSLRIAASRAGIDATLPDYKPPGFSLSGPINYSEGIVTINFGTGTDDRNFQIVERESSWDSKSLLANYVEQQSPNYVTFQDRGLTIYVFEGSQATWVDSGIWYSIEGDSQLNSDQLLKIAASM